jgi:hypothetical protein
VRGAVQGKGEDLMKLFAVLLMTLPLFVACAKQGPLESAGKSVDKTIKDVKSGGEKTAKKVDDAIDDAKDGANDAVKDLNK